MTEPLSKADIQGLQSEFLKKGRCNLHCVQNMKHRRILVLHSGGKKTGRNHERNEAN